MRKTLFKIGLYLIVLLSVISTFKLNVYADVKDYNIPQGKSLFLYLAQVDPKKAVWESNNVNVAMVSNGIIYAKSEGQALVTAKINNDPVMVYKINVTKPEGIKFTYTYPNNPIVGENVELVAITNTHIDSVRFKVNINGNINTFLAATKNLEEDVYIWKATVKTANAGTFLFKTEFLKNGQWNSDSSGDNDIFVDNTDGTVQRVKERRASDKCIDFIESWEGFKKDIGKDFLTKDNYDIGYGNAIHSGETFYNSITKSQARALLCRSINTGKYSKCVNDFLIKNNIKFNQNQFDALLSFTYNLGINWMKSSNLRESILKSRDPKLVVKGKVIYKSGINLRIQPNINSQVLKVLENDSEVILQSTQKYNGDWYQVKTESGDVGFCYFEGIHPFISNQTVYCELGNIDRESFSKCFLIYHHAGGKCIKGLMYRRIDELEMFFFNDYLRDGHINKYGFSMQCTK